MKKLLVLFTLLALMIGSFSLGGFASDANFYEDIEEALPAEPAL